MKQLSSRILATVLCLTLIASAVVGALSVSVLPAKADEFPVSGYLDDLFAAAFQDVPENNRVTLEYYQSLFDECFDDYLIVVIHDTVLNGWYFAAYDGTDGADPVRWCLNNGSYSPYYTTLIAKYSNNGYYTTSCNFIGGCKFQGSSWFSHGGDSMNYDKLSQVVHWNSGWEYLTPNPLYVNMSGYECYSNRDLYKWNNDDPSDSRFMVANLNPGSDIPPTIEIYLKAFWLGERRYLTLTDQALVRGLDPDKDNSTWYFFNNEDLDYDLYDWRIVTWDNILLIPGGESFVSGLTNVSPLGVYAYDITDLWWAEIDSSYLEDDEGNIFAVALNTPFVVQEEAPEPGTDGQPSSETIIYQYINNYVSNYPSVTIVPEQLASQLAGTTAFSSGTGFLTFPDQLIKYVNGDDQDYSGEFRYDLSQSGLDPDEFSMLNFDLFNVVIVPGRIDVDYFYLNYWDSSVTPTLSDWQGVNRYTVSQNLIDKYNYTNDLFESFDLVIFAPYTFFQDTGTPYDGSKDRNVGYIGDIGRYHSLDELYRSPMFWILTKSAIEKSHLYVFCDGFGKLYNLATQVCNKRDLWDSSFFDWSLSIFYELQTIGGLLNSIDFTIKSWDLGNKLSDIVDSLNRIADNTDELQEPMWYESLWNWVRQFTPSDSAFLTGLNAIDDGFDNIPLLPVPTNYPTYPLLPTFTPTPVPDPGGE